MAAPLRTVFPRELKKRSSTESTLRFRCMTLAIFSNYLSLKSALMRCQPRSKPSSRSGRTRLVDHTVIEKLHHMAEDWQRLGTLARSARTGRARAAGKPPTVSPPQNRFRYGLVKRRILPSFAWHQTPPTFSLVCLRMIGLSDKGSSMSSLQHLLVQNRRWAEEMVERDPDCFSRLAGAADTKLSVDCTADGRVPANRSPDLHRAGVCPSQRRQLVITPTSTCCRCCNTPSMCSKSATSSSADTMAAAVYVPHWRASNWPYRKLACHIQDTARHHKIEQSVDMTDDARRAAPVNQTSSSRC